MENVLCESLTEELLKEHPCVVIPGFGAFIRRETPALVNRINHQAKPAGTQLLFNPAVTSDDGLFTSHIQTRQQLPYADARAAVSAFTAEMFTRLSLGKPVVFGKLGTLFKNQDGGIFLVPNNKLNLNKESFGLEPVALKKKSVTTQPVSAPVSAAEPAVQPKANILREIPAERQTEETRFSEPEAAELKPFKRSSQQAWKAVATIVLIATALVLGERVFRSAEPLKASLFGKGKTEISSPPAETVNPQAETTSANPSINAKTTVSNGSESVSTETVDPSKALTIENGELGKYSIIAGSFLIADNAQKAASDLIARGLAVRLVKYKNQSLIRVVVQEYEDEKDALSMKNQIDGKFGSTFFMVKKLK